MTKRMGSQTSGQAHPTTAAQSLPPQLAEVSLIDAKTSAAVGDMGISWWHEKVAAGDAPQPVIRAPRCTRWRAVDVVAFWAKFAEQAQGNAESASAVFSKATKASAAARAKRTASRSGVDA